MFNRFLEQPARRYRSFQVVYALLALNFLIPAASYAWAPHLAVEQYLRINALLGGLPYVHHEADSHLWRYLAAANVMTLGMMCVLLLANLRRFYAVLWPLTFMKAFAALSWLGGYLQEAHTPVFLGAAILDGVTCVLFVVFARRAHAEIVPLQDDQLVPRPWLWVDGHGPR